MKLLFLAPAAFLLVTSDALPRQPHHYGPPSWNHGSKKAVYFLSVDPSGSSVNAIGLDHNGMLTESTSVTSTDGNGLQGVNATSLDLAPVAIDPLQGQTAVSVGDNYLFTINSGSNTAVMFEIDPSNPLSLAMIGGPKETLGEFPMAIAYSSKFKKACVLNGGAINGVTCYSVDDNVGLVPDGIGLRKFGYASTTPPQLFGAKGSGSDIQFSGDSMKLITTFKGRNMPKMTLGHISIFDVDEAGNVSKTWTPNRVSPIVQPFGFALSGKSLNELYISDATFGGVLVSFDYETNKVTALSTVNETSFGAAASCWAVYSEDTGYFYDINAGSPNFGIVSSEGELIEHVDYKKALGGGVDSVAAGGKLYMLTATNAIAVFDLGSDKLMQTYRYGDLSERPYWTGLAMWPSNLLLTGGV